MLPNFPYKTIDRDSLQRNHPAQIEQLLRGENSRILLWHEGKLICPLTRPLYFLFHELACVMHHLSEPVYLGQYQQHVYFTCHLEHWHEQFDGLDLCGLRSLGRCNQDHDLGLLFYAQGIINWHQNHAFCSHCGGEMQLSQGGHARTCLNSSCGKTQYPKIDPAVIFSIATRQEQHDKILLGRKAEWDDGRYSVIAGFVEPGEALEDAVRREALEETNISIDKVEYIASQSWPFPNALMVGFHCEASEQAIKRVDNELEKAGWFSAQEIETGIKAGLLSMPYSVSIAWHLIDRWFTQQTGYSIDSIQPSIEA